MTLTFTSNLDQVLRGLDDLSARQIPYAASRALNDAAKAVQDAGRLEMLRAFDRPTSFTLASLGITYASKTNLAATVAARPLAAPMLARLAHGGHRIPPKTDLYIPVRARLNSFGNLPRGALKRTIHDPGNFVARRGDPKTAMLKPGVYRRGIDGGKPQMLIAFTDDAFYRPIFAFEQVAEAAALRTFEPAFVRRLAEAIASGR